MKLVENVLTCLAINMIRREATISTYIDRAKFMAKINPRKCMIQNPSTSILSPILEEEDSSLSKADLMKKYTVNNIKQLQKLILELFVDEYDNELHFDQNYINYAYRSMHFLWQKAQNFFVDSKLEWWYQMNIWSYLINPAFDNQNFELVCSKSMSFASSNRKNLKKTVNDKKKIGHKDNGVFRLSGDHLESTEAKHKWKGKSETS
ncbi:hypothetical protein C1645_735509 [Glomus cerebriforme]|uniref:Uncharacterized protein n=1 Tax=Glomus cerebriforme TaxID=658196 RepID=A0A397TAQ9_9GLOM|nr:hypothetical protein C1645_735509 [Glomus cerebriforme]